MDKTITYPGLQFRFLRGSLLTGFFALFVQLSFAQDYDFVQTDDPHKLVVMEAENASSNTAKGDASWTPTDSPAEFSGQGAMMAVASAPFTAKDAVLAGSAILAFKINFIKSGLHYIWARASRTGGGDDSYHAGIDGDLTDSSMFLTFHKTTFTNGTWGWINYRSTAGPANLHIPSAGVHELNVYIRENGFRIDKILLTDDDSSSYKPTGMGPDETLPSSAIPPVAMDNNVLSVFPNPVNDQLNIQIKDNRYTTGILKIVDLQGRLMQRIDLENSLTSIADVSHLESGVYFLKFEQNDQLIAINKFIKN